MLVAFDDLDSPKRPGEYILAGRRVIVTWREVEKWRRRPETLFRIVPAGKPNAPAVYKLIDGHR